MGVAFKEKVLNKHSVTYFYCNNCGLLQTETPYWLEEAYGKAISDLDTGVIARNLNNRRLIEPILHMLFGDRVKVLDIGGGYGLFARLLRDIGYDCYSYDKYCENLFARPFEPGAGFKADVLVAFEVMEHIEDASHFLEQMFSSYGAKTIIFSTLTFAREVPAKDWWYYCFESGQHISFYQPKTLATLADRFGCKYARLGHDLHIITNRRISRIQLYVLRRSRLFRLYGHYVRFRRRSASKTWNDHVELKHKQKYEN